MPLRCSASAQISVTARRLWLCKSVYGVCFSPVSAASQVAACSHKKAGVIPGERIARCCACLLHQLSLIMAVAIPTFLLFFGLIIHSLAQAAAIDLLGSL